MYKILSAAVLILTAAVLGCAAFAAHAEEFTLASADVKKDQPLSLNQVFNGFGCKGKNLSPQLSWQGEPAGTKSFAITVYDPDAPTGSGWWHWSVFNIPASVHSLPGAIGAHGEGLPEGALQGRTDFGSSSFGGACPPEGDKPHRYQFVVWALKADKLPLDAQASGAMLSYMLNANVIGKAKLNATYGRSASNEKAN